MNGTMKVVDGASFNFHGLIIVYDECSVQPAASFEVLGSLWMGRSATLNPTKAVELDIMAGTVKYSSDIKINGQKAARMSGTMKVRLKLRK